MKGGDIMNNNENKEVKDLNTSEAKKVSGGFSFNENYSKGNNYESKYTNYSLSEKERESLRNLGCKFELDEFGEIKSVINKQDKQLTAEEIGTMLYSNGSNK